mgnify:FL=1
MSIASDVLLKETVARVAALEREMMELKANLPMQKPAGVETDNRGASSGTKITLNRK